MKIKKNILKFWAALAIQCLLFLSTIFLCLPFFVEFIPFGTIIQRILNGILFFLLFGTTAYQVKVTHSSVLRIVYTIIAFLLSSCYFWIQSLELVSFTLCHETFDFLFFQNFNLAALKQKSMILPYWKEIFSIFGLYVSFLLASVYFFLLDFSKIIISRKRCIFIDIILFALCFIVAFGPCSPVFSFFRAQANYCSLRKINVSCYSPSQNDIVEFKKSGLCFPLQDPSAIYCNSGKNVVFVQFESLNSDFINQDLYPGLLKCMKKMYDDKNTVRFTNFCNSTANTFISFFQTRTGMPFPKNYNPGNSNYSGKILSVVSLLKKGGYYTEHIQTADLPFCATDKMCQDMQYDEFYEIRDRKFSRYSNDGGDACDHRLFAIGFDEFVRLGKKGKPFFLSLFTYDGHNPTGIQDSLTMRYCGGKYDNDLLLNANHTTDRYFGDFIDKISKTPYWKDTVVIICNDHSLRSHKPSGNNPKLDFPNPNIMLLFALNVDAEFSGENRYRGYTYDIAPLILDLAGIKTNYIFPLGVSALRAMEEKKPYCDKFGVLEKYFSANTFLRKSDFGAKISLSHGEYFTQRKVHVGNDQFNSMYNLRRWLPDSGCAELFIFNKDGSFVKHCDIKAEEFENIFNNNRDSQYIIIAGPNASFPHHLHIPENPDRCIFAYVSSNGLCRYTLFSTKDKKAGVIVLPDK